jgi:hypothetical protein
MAEFNNITVHGNLQVTGSLLMNGPLSMRNGGTGSTSFPAEALLMVNGDGKTINYASRTGTGIYNGIKASECVRAEYATEGTYVKDTRTSGVKIYASYSGAALGFGDNFMLAGYTTTGHTLIHVSNDHLTLGNATQWNGYPLNYGSYSSTANSFSIV